jgi:16S rRNA processing protein RimM
MPRPEWIEVGRISRPHGVHGEVRVALSSDNPERFRPGVTLHARPGRTGIAGPRLREQVRLTVETARGDEAFPIVGFREIPDRDTAESLSGYVLEVRSSELPELEEGEFYPFDLVGLEARDPEGGVVGQVTDALDSPAHAILIVALRGGGEGLVPFVQAAVPHVGLADGYLVVDPELMSIVGAPSGDQLVSDESGDGGGPADTSSGPPESGRS